MSDARKTPPSFDEMVGLIEKLFKDYLEDVMKSSPNEKERAWVRYKTLNHLYQNEALHPSESSGVRMTDLTPEESLILDQTFERVVKRESTGVKGAVWVKAVNYKPSSKMEYRPYRRRRDDNDLLFDYGEIYVTTDAGDVFFDIDHEREYDRSTDDRWKDYEILDESGSAARSGKEEAIISDDELFKLVEDITTNQYGREPMDDMIKKMGIVRKFITTYTNNQNSQS